MNGGATPLFIACQEGHTEIAAALIAAGAKVNQAMDGGVTPLMEACHQGHTEIAAALLAAGAKVNQAKDSGATPLYWACRSNRLSTVQLLSSYGANRVSISARRRTYPLQLCIRGELVVVLFVVVVCRAEAPRLHSLGGTIAAAATILPVDAARAPPTRTARGEMPRLTRAHASLRVASRATSSSRASRPGSRASRSASRAAAAAEEGREGRDGMRCQRGSRSHELSSGRRSRRLELVRSCLLAVTNGAASADDAQVQRATLLLPRSEATEAGRRGGGCLGSPDRAVSRAANLAALLRSRAKGEVGAADAAGAAGATAGQEADSGPATQMPPRSELVSRTACRPSCRNARSMRADAASALCSRALARACACALSLWDLTRSSAAARSAASAAARAAACASLSAASEASRAVAALASSSCAARRFSAAACSCAVASRARSAASSRARASSAAASRASACCAATRTSASCAETAAAAAREGSNPAAVADEAGGTSHGGAAQAAACAMPWLAPVAAVGLAVRSHVAHAVTSSSRRRATCQPSRALAFCFAWNSAARARRVASRSWLCCVGATPESSSPESSSLSVLTTSVTSSFVTTASGMLAASQARATFGASVPRPGIGGGHRPRARGRESARAAPTKRQNQSAETALQTCSRGAYGLYR